MTIELKQMYTDLAGKVWDKMVSMVGVHTVMVLVRRTVWVTSQKYEDASGIRFDENGISFEDLSGDEEIIKELLEEFFGTLVMILSKLVGKEIAQKILEELDDLQK